MKHSISKLHFILLLSVGFILGLGVACVIFWLAIVPGNDGQVTGAVEQNPTDTNEPDDREQSIASEVGDSGGLSPPAIRNLAELNKIKSLFDRELALRTLLAESDETQIAEMLSQSLELPSNNHLYAVQVAVVQRFTQLNPNRVVSRVLKLNQRHRPDRFVTVIFREWAHVNLDGAVTRARTLNETWRDSALRTILMERIDLSEDRRRSIAKEVGNEEIALSVFKEEMIERAMENPESLWEELVRESKNEWIDMWNLAQVALSWIEKNGLEVLDQVNQSLTNRRVRENVVSSILQEVAETNPSWAYTYSLTMEDNLYHSTTKSVLRTWTKSDPNAALAAVSKIEGRILRRELEEHIVEIFATEEPWNVLGNVDVLPEHVRTTAVSTALKKVSTYAPEEAAALIGRMEAGKAQTSAANGVVNRWATQDPKAALDWILNEPGIEEIRMDLLESALYSVVNVDPHLALATARSQQPIDEEMEMLGLGMEYSLISMIAHTDLDKAIELLPQVREGPSRKNAFEAVVGMMIQNGDVDGALDMIQQFPESGRTDLYLAAASEWAEFDPEGLLNSMSRFPSEHLRSKVALMLVSDRKHQNSLSNEQKERAKSFLRVEDAKSLKEG